MIETVIIIIKNCSALKFFKKIVARVHKTKLYKTLVKLRNKFTDKLRTNV
jgi:hypothetical protein